MYIWPPAYEGLTQSVVFPDNSLRFYYLFAYVLLCLLFETGSLIELKPHWILHDSLLPRLCDPASASPVLGLYECIRMPDCYVGSDYQRSVSHVCTKSTL